MLNSITIQNFITVSQLTLEFQNGLHILTGETGAGKSIWIDALGLALGNRADSNQIRHNQKQCDVTLCFDISNNKTAIDWLNQQALSNDESECIIRRTIHRDGKSRASINATPCTLAQLKAFSQHIIQIHGQHQQQTLLKAEHQRQQFDHYAKHQPLLEKITNTYKQWQLIDKELLMLKNQTGNQQSEIDLLRYQLNELTTLNLQADEWKQLSEQHQKLHNARELITQLNQAIDLTAENAEVSAAALVDQAITELNTIKHQDTQLTAIKELLSNASIHLQEAATEINDYRDQLDLSPEHLVEVEQRLSLIHDIARKHHANPEDLLEIQQSIQHKLHQLEHRDEDIAKLEKTQKALLKQYQTFAKKLTESRHKVAKQFNKTITDYMRGLGIDAGEFKVQLIPIEECINPHGQEQVWFSVKTNPKQDFQPMQKIVSGGELSRISLAVQLITATQYQTPTLIFDEVDVGIGGKTAATVGSMLRELGANTQVLCITHLPQVAAHAHHHFKVEKQTSKEDVMTKVALLDEQGRVEEVARMLGGRKITQQTLAHASEMLAL
ncbi:MAG: DNA repair protein RecN [Gammaproteobacteria bacterium]|nr:DNA repair protein RecN [Gammaproteobacteria bacterium]